MKKISLTKEELNALVIYRIKRARETLAEADNLIKDNFYNAAVNRLYYACYYAVIALLVKNDITAHTHHGVKQMFSLHFISKNIIDKQHSVFYSRLFNDRMSGDYDDFVQYNAEMVNPMRQQTEKFIVVIEDALNKIL